MYKQVALYAYEINPQILTGETEMLSSGRLLKPSLRRPTLRMTICCFHHPTHVTSKPATRNLQPSHLRFLNFITGNVAAVISKIEIHISRCPACLGAYFLTGAPVFFPECQF